MMDINSMLRSPAQGACAHASVSIMTSLHAGLALQYANLVLIEFPQSREQSPQLAHCLPHAEAAREKLN